MVLARRPTARARGNGRRTRGRGAERDAREGRRGANRVTSPYLSPRHGITIAQPQSPHTFDKLLLRNRMHRLPSPSSCYPLRSHTRRFPARTLRRATGHEPRARPGRRMSWATRASHVLPSRAGARSRGCVICALLPAQSSPRPAARVGCFAQRSIPKLHASCFALIRTCLIERTCRLRRPSAPQFCSLFTLATPPGPASAPPNNPLRQQHSARGKAKPPQSTLNHAY